MNGSAHEIVEFDQAQFPAAGAMLARAFDDDPMMECLFPDQRRRPARAGWLLGACLRYGLLYGRTYTTPDLAGVSIWIPPGSASLGVWQMFRCGMGLAPLRIGWLALARLVHLSRLADRAHHRVAPDPHWHLFTLAVDPAHQCRGLGRALLAPGLALADYDRLPVYLETTTEKNVAYYQRHGFEVSVRETSSRTGLTFWGMTRKK